MLDGNIKISVCGVLAHSVPHLEDLMDAAEKACARVYKVNISVTFLTHILPETSYSKRPLLSQFRCASLPLNDRRLAAGCICSVVLCP